jgi:hypothetical protein
VSHGENMANFHHLSLARRFETERVSFFFARHALKKAKIVLAAEKMMMMMMMLKVVCSEPD